MSGAAKEIRSKIKSIQSTKKITHAMELVSASKLKKAQGMLQAARPYAKKIKTISHDLVLTNQHEKHPFLVKRDIKKVAYIIISSKRGLCGGLNPNLFRDILKDMGQKKKENIEVFACVVGTKAINFFKKIDCHIMAALEPTTDIPTLEELIGLIGIALRSFENRDVDELYLCYNAFKSSLDQRPTLDLLLPLTFDAKPTQSEQEFFFQEDSSLILNLILTRYIESSIYESILENFTCEQAARMVAMKSATDNASSLINELTLVYNKARQSAITQEITEIVSGAAALT